MGKYSFPDAAVGFVGFGEVNSSFAEGLASEGVKKQVATDVVMNDPVRGKPIHAAAQISGTSLTGSYEQLAQASDVIISAVPGVYARDAAESIAPFLRSGQLYVDVAASHPDVKREIGSIVGERCLVVDGAIMLPPLKRKHRINISVSGPGATDFADLFIPVGMNVDIISEKVGDATTLKMLRSLFMKGKTALLFETLIGAHRLGIHGDVSKTISKTIDAQGFEEIINHALTSGAIHATRRAQELHAATEVLEGLGVESLVTSAAAARYQRIADLGLADVYQGIVPETYAEVLDVIDDHIKAQTGLA